MRSQKVRIEWSELFQKLGIRDLNSDCRNWWGAKIIWGPKNHQYIKGSNFRFYGIFRHDANVILVVALNKCIGQNLSTAGLNGTFSASLLRSKIRKLVWGKEVEP